MHADEPTRRLDARAAQIVMRVVRAIGDNNRTIVCTIHQPSAEIFGNFDELLLLKRGGHQIFYGPLGPDSQNLVEYFQSVPGTVQLKAGYNPATYMLEVRKTCVRTLTKTKTLTLTLVFIFCQLPVRAPRNLTETLRFGEAVYCALPEAALGQASRHLFVQCM